ncbi:MAG: hypothetical protein ACREBR_03200 [bacterium]
MNGKTDENDELRMMLWHVFVVIKFQIVAIMSQDDSLDSVSPLKRIRRSSSDSGDDEINVDRPAIAISPVRNPYNRNATDTGNDERNVDRRPIVNSSLRNLYNRNAADTADDAINVDRPPITISPVRNPCMHNPVPPFAAAGEIVEAPRHQAFRVCSNGRTVFQNIAEQLADLVVVGNMSNTQGRKLLLVEDNLFPIGDEEIPDDSDMGFSNAVAGTVSGFTNMVERALGPALRNLNIEKIPTLDDFWSLSIDNKVVPSKSPHDVVGIVWPRNSASIQSTNRLNVDEKKWKNNQFHLNASFWSDQQDYRMLKDGSGKHILMDIGIKVPKDLIALDDIGSYDEAMHNFDSIGGLLPGLSMDFIAATLRGPLASILSRFMNCRLVQQSRKRGFFPLLVFKNMLLTRNLYGAPKKLSLASCDMGRKTAIGLLGFVRGKGATLTVVSATSTEDRSALGGELFLI